MMIINILWQKRHFVHYGWSYKNGLEGPSYGLLALNSCCPESVKDNLEIPQLLQFLDQKTKIQNGQIT